MPGDDAEGILEAAAEVDANRVLEQRREAAHRAGQGAASGDEDEDEEEEESAWLRSRSANAQSRVHSSIHVGVL